MRLNEESLAEANRGVLTDVIAIDVIRWVLAHLWTPGEALDYCGQRDARAFVAGPIFSMAAVIAWSDPAAFERCRARVRAKLSGGGACSRWTQFFRPRTLPRDLPEALDSLWLLVEDQHAHQFGAS